MDNIELEQRLDRIERLLIANKEVLTFEEACEYMGISRSFLYKLTSTRKIPHSKPNGKMIFFEKKKLNVWLLQNGRKSKEEIESEALKYSLNNNTK
ncbi:MULTISPECIES: helix-turn-helix domain-containing protein [Flagellimonas]|jgi:excisionase family DNA binding protein|uniref:DNA-binding protein n=2 Tax=Flagellimonas TaxID=444459 RepID=A0A3A1NN45_9FLAO|nr:MULTISPECIES: helix-turn-helix domain-containing protein [Allomuricauda]NDV42675.1 helix-turn-helix domain-containing protein [Allomuricauda sediminis]RIV46134.1 DNA-binding protein [Allomuricauda maritima]TXJ98777.1 helix-turn-helix domain-containing protein [Allomuricauda maritima]|tara:strand:+ start:1819 stop:2106 length:288 start_codon:yes stop_codon:yes gene_type:complete